ncbi:MAG TPA: hypothetical protein VE825_15060 [Terriglobales bacterium]|jgi:Tfp pilus assembly protein PilP|nr:hypothetical protein [Terriglobales bacterium]
MKMLKLIFVLLIAAGVALGQAPGKKNGSSKSKPGTAAASTAPAHQATKAAAPHATSPMAPKPAKHAAAKPPAAAPAPAAQAVAGRGKRDPFVNPVVARGPGPGPCAGGKRCLAIDQLVVRGVVKAPKGWIAIVENPAKTTYFLNDNDELYDGTVVKITGDSVVFKQNVLDTMGRTSTRQVEKKLSGPAV